MVTFVCYNCDVTLKKAQLERHTFQCRPAKFICIDCSKTFDGNDYKLHTSCMTEEQKYFGQYAKKTKQQLHQERLEGQARKAAEIAAAAAAKAAKEAEEAAAAQDEEEEEVEETEGKNWPGWKKTIKKIVKQKANKKMKLLKLKELACKKYQENYPSQKLKDIEAIFDEKIGANSKFQITQEPYVSFSN